MAATALAINMLATATSAPTNDLEAVDVAQVHDAFARARAWVTEFDTPRMEAPEAKLALTEATGVCVILRRHGRVLGIGMDDAGDDLMVRRAVGRALNETLSDPALQAVASAIRSAAGAGQVGAAGSRPDTRPEQEAEARLDALRRDVGRSLTLELEIAGPRTPLVGATLAALAAKIEPGIDGVSLRHQRQWSHAFPASLRAANLGGEPLKTLTSLAVNAGIPMAELGETNAPADSSFYAFRSVDLAQAKPDDPPVELLRGERLVSIDDITRTRINMLANGLAQHLLRRRFPEPPDGQPRLPLGFMGDYSPVSDQFASTVALPLDQALCALALTRFAQTPGVDAQLARDAAVAARQTLRDLAEQAPREESAMDDRSACAVIVMVACEMPSCMGDAHVGAMVRQAYSNLLAATPETPLVSAMVGCALARAMVSKVDGLPPIKPELVRTMLDQAWSGAAENQQVALLPWIGWAERDYAAAAGQPLAHVEELKRMVAALDRVRAKESAETAADLVGGLALTGSTNDKASGPRPTSQTARPAAWLASIGSVQALVPPDRRIQAWSGHLQTMRFLCQLAVSDLRGATFRNSARAVGGVCAAPGDSRQLLPAQALVMIAAVETLKNWPNSPN